jgi:uncharacterized protein YlzI (FlbEa/FlbD family)
MDTVLQLTRLSGPLFALNPDLIERAESTPDTVVTLVNGSKYVIRESLDELVELIQAYRADIIVAAHHAGVAGFADDSDGPGGYAPLTAHASSGHSRSATGRPESSTHATVVPLHPGDE